MLSRAKLSAIPGRLFSALADVALQRVEVLLAGIELIRVTGTRLDREPRETIARVAAHLERRRRAGGPRRSVA